MAVRLGGARQRVETILKDRSLIGTRREQICDAAWAPAIWGAKPAASSTSTPDRPQRNAVVRHLAPMAPSCRDWRLGPPGREAGVVSCAVWVWRVSVATGRAM
jgi:hypothetical protein